MNRPPERLTPLPARIASLLAGGGPSNLSLYRDRAAFFQRNMRPSRREGEAKAELEHDKEFLAHFVERFNAAGTGNREEFAERKKRRLHTFGNHVHALTLTTRARLVVGLGLPQSGKENSALLLDRLTGCPYVPGSSVKGLARQAAREIAESRLEGDRQFWSANRGRIFGFQSQDSSSVGTVVFYDAFPATWPELELDVLTPHYKAYYEDPTAVPGDWETPVPIQFVVVKRNQAFDFFFRGLHATRRSMDEEQTAVLLRTALDWIGLGGKRSSGYGSFEPGRSTPADAVKKIAIWEGAQITWIPNSRKLKITSGGHSCEATWEPLISERDKERIKSSRKAIIADVEVRELGIKSFEAVRITLRS